MTESMLARLGLTPEQVDLLPKKTARPVINFLLRWEAYADALDCLDLWQDDGFVTTMDARARALMGLGRHEEAAVIMEERIGMYRSVTSEQLYGDALMRAGQIDRAFALAHEMTEGYPQGAGGWALLGDLCLMMGDLMRAEGAYLRLQEMSETKLEPTIGLATIALLRSDPITASAYATRAFGTGGEGVAATVEELRVLLEIFSAIPDENKAQEVKALLVQRFEREFTSALEQVQAAGVKTVRRQPRQDAGAREARPAQAPPTAPPDLSDLAAIPVSVEEHRLFTVAARQLFGFDHLLPAQPQILASAHRGEDVLAILPTGGGKSLCYQLPAFLDFAGDNGASLAANGAPLGPITLVVSPLIALMKDQVDNLPGPLGDHTLALNSSLDGYELQQRLRDLANGRYRMVYAAPERLRQWPFLDVLRRRGLARLVIDEAHCVSSWGHNFRPDYLHIAQAHRDLEAPPILALTATAPTRVRQDIEQQLLGRAESTGPRRMAVIAGDSFRPNLHLSAIRAANTDEKQNALLGLCRALGGSGIVYARTRALTEELAAMLRSRGEDAVAFHAGMSPTDRAAIQECFIAGETRILVATVAFGMGIDKPDIRFILHFGLPASLEGYYQEAGRAGRDGHPAHCVLIFAAGDKSVLTGLANREEIGVEFLRQVYMQARRRMQRRNPGAFAMDDLVRDLQADETPLRVALSLLEEAGLIRRHYDVPRTVGLGLRATPQEPAALDFVRRTGLSQARDSTFAYMELCALCAADASLFERRLLEWQAAGWLRVNASGRDVLLAILPPPPDSEQRIAALVDRLRTVRAQQVAEIYAYARTRNCRHGYLSAYLGGTARKNCGHCDNCAGPSLPAHDAGLPDEHEQEAIILRAIRERSLGRKNIARILRGDSDVEPRFQTMKAYGALAFRSEAAIGHLLDDMVEKGLLEERRFGETGVVLQLSAQGWQRVRAA